MLANLQHPPDERRELSQLQERWPSYLPRRRVRQVPGKNHRAKHRLLEHYPGRRDPPSHQRDQKADLVPQDPYRTPHQFETELTGMPVTTTKYVIKYKLNGERRFEFAQLQAGSIEEAKEALAKIHDASDEITDINVSKAL